MSREASAAPRAACWRLYLQAEKFRAKAHKAEAWRSAVQYCRYLYYMARIRTIQLEYSEAKDCLQQVRAPGQGRERRGVACLWGFK